MFTGLESPTHLLFIAVIALIFLGPKRLPEVGRSLGSGLRNFKDSISGNAPDGEPPANATLHSAQTSEPVERV